MVAILFLALLLPQAVVVVVLTHLHPPLLRLAKAVQAVLEAAVLSRIPQIQPILVEPEIRHPLAHLKVSLAVALFTLLRHTIMVVAVAHLP